MKVSDLTFYPLHINVMNFSEPMQHLKAIQCHTLQSFLPVQFGHANYDTYGEENCIEQLSKLEKIHHCIIQAMKPVADTGI